VRRMHVHEHQAALRLREDIDAMQLRDRKAERVLHVARLHGGPMRGLRHVLCRRARLEIPDPAAERPVQFE